MNYFSVFVVVLLALQLPLGIALGKWIKRGGLRET